MLSIYSILGYLYLRLFLVAKIADFEVESNYNLKEILFS